MRKINKEELNQKSDWIATSLVHERYTFDMETIIFKNKTIIELLDELGFWGLENKIEKYESSNTYLLDEIYHEDKDCDTWCLTEQEKARFRPLHIKAVSFMKLEDFLNNNGSGSMIGCFGDTNRKYGLMDYAENPAEMENNKNAI